MTIVEMCVHMDCSGCESKIRKALQKLEGVDDVDIDIARQKVTVTGWAEQKKVLKAVRKTGKRAVVWPYPYNPEYQTYSQEYYHQHQPTSSHSHVDFSTAADTQYYYSSTAAPASSYNYRKHGYDDFDMNGYYQRPAYSTIVDERAGNLFSDDNPNACSIM